MFYIIEKSKLAENIAAVKNYVAAPLLAVVKGDGYGLGLVDYSSFLRENGVERFGVADPFEAFVLAENGFDDILLISPENDRDILGELILKNVTLTAGSVENIALIDDVALELDKTARVHLKIDTGFGRFGFHYKDVDVILNIFDSVKNIKITGIFSHFSCSFEKKYKITALQNKRFAAIVNLLKDKNLTAHIANSCAALRFPETHFNAVRIGSAFLGRLPVKSPVKLNKIGYLKTRIIDVNTVKKGENIGYGNTYTAKSDIKTATVAVGYKDGFDLKKSDDTFRFIDILRYIFGNLKSYNKKLYLYKNEDMVLGRVGMCSTTILNDKNYKPNDQIKVDASPLFVDRGIKRIYEN